MPYNYKHAEVHAFSFFNAVIELNYKKHMMEHVYANSLYFQSTSAALC